MSTRTDYPTTALDLARALGRYTPKAGGGYKGQCPAHEDRTPSLSIDDAPDGKILVNCQATCTQPQVIAALQARGLWPGGDDSRPVEPVRPVPVERSPKVSWRPVMPVPADAPAPPHTHWSGVRYTHRWEYRDAEGRLLFCTMRLPLEGGGKDVIPHCYCEHPEDPTRRRWSSRAPERPRPLYGLHLLAAKPNARVMVVEGEKACDAFNRAYAGTEWVAVTWQGGGKSAHLADWSVLAGREVWIWPDADDPGITAARKIARCLSEIPAIPAFRNSLRVAEILDSHRSHPADPGFPAPDPMGIPSLPSEILEKAAEFSGFDAADAEILGWTTAQVFDFLTAAEGLPRISAAPGEISASAPRISNAGSSGLAGSSPSGSEISAGAGRGNPGIPFGTEKHTPRNHGSRGPGDRLPTLVALGHDRDTYYYLSRESGQVHSLTASAHKKLNLLSLVSSFNYWESIAPGAKGGPDWDAIAENLMAQCKGQGIFSSDRIRGRGAWHDAGRVVLHLGDRLMIDGKESDVLARPGEFVYEAGARMDGPAGDPLTDDEARRVLETAGMFRFENPVAALFVAGWVALAPVCGALSWRPHIWITGQSGTGKSTLIEQFITPLLGGVFLSVQGGSSEAGIRQQLGHDALPVLMEEAEADSEREQERRQMILQLMRQASSESQAKTLKGGQTGRAVSYHIRSMFALASVGVGLKAQADQSRVAVVTLARPGGEEHWKALQTALGTFDRSLARRLIARTVGLVPVIRENARVLATAVAAVSASQRLGDQYGALLAGAWSLKSSTTMTQEEAHEYVASLDLSGHGQDSIDPDEVQCLQHMLQYLMRWDPSVPPMTIGELAQIAAQISPGVGRVDYGAASDLLRRHGIKVEISDRQILVANRGRELENQIFRGTPWQVGWHRFLSRLPGAEPTKTAKHFAPGHKQRAIALPFDVVINAEEVYNDDIPF